MRPWIILPNTIMPDGLLPIYRDPNLVQDIVSMRGRFFITKDIKGYYGTNTHYTQSADRFRLDFNVSF